MCRRRSQQEKENRNEEIHETSCFTHLLSKLYIRSMRPALKKWDQPEASRCGTHVPFSARVCGCFFPRVLVTTIGTVGRFLKVPAMGRRRSDFKADRIALLSD